MFKKVEYTGFDGHPELESKARHATGVLGGVIRDWRDDVIVTWRPSVTEALELALALVLPDASATATGQVPLRGFDPGEDSLLRMEIREVWLDVLDRLIGQVATRLEGSLSTPVEV